MSCDTKSTVFCWNELATTNVQAAKDFYGKVFGWTFTEHDMGGMMYTVITKGNGKDDCGFGGIWAIPKEQQNQIPPHWMSYISVDNVDATLQIATKNGAKIIKEAMNVGECGRLAIIQDPTGAHIAMWQQLKKD